MVRLSPGSVIVDLVIAGDVYGLDALSVAEELARQLLDSNSLLRLGTLTRFAQASINV